MPRVPVLRDHQLQVVDGRRVEDEMVIRFEVTYLAEVRGADLLSLVDIMDRRARRAHGVFATRKPEPVQGSDAELGPEQ
jgi:hypothetical protein